MAALYVRAGGLVLPQGSEVAGGCYAYWGPEVLGLSATSAQPPQIPEPEEAWSRSAATSATSATAVPEGEAVAIA